MIYISGDDLRMSPIVYWTIYEGKAFTQFYGPFHMDQAYIERAQYCSKAVTSFFLKKISNDKQRPLDFEGNISNKKIHTTCCTNYCNIFTIFCPLCQTWKETSRGSKGCRCWGNFQLWHQCRLLWCTTLKNCDILVHTLRSAKYRQLIMYYLGEVVICVGIVSVRSISFFSYRPIPIGTDMFNFLIGQYR